MRRSRAAALIVAAVLGGATGGAFGAQSGAPAGATAQCRDGTYSFSRTHSGTCSWHGGVAVWLDGSSAAGSSSTVSRTSESTASFALGATVTLAARTRTSGCRLGPSPDRACSPGAFYGGLTASVICSSTFRTSDVRNVPESEKHAVELEYGMTPGSYGSTLEIDHIVSLELGGSNDIANLFPEKADAAPGYHVKDRLENRLHALVCSGAMTLHAAQQGIAENWQALYRQVFGSAPTS